MHNQRLHSSCGHTQSMPPLFVLQNLLPLTLNTLQQSPLPSLFRHLYMAAVALSYLTNIQS